MTRRKPSLRDPSSARADGEFSVFRGICRAFYRRRSRTDGRILGGWLHRRNSVVCLSRTHYRVSIWTRELGKGTLCGRITSNLGYRKDPKRESCVLDIVIMRRASYVDREHVGREDSGTDTDTDRDTGGSFFTIISATNLSSTCIYIPIARAKSSIWCHCMARTMVARSPARVWQVWQKYDCCPMPLVQTVKKVPVPQPDKVRVPRLCCTTPQYSVWDPVRQARC